MLQAGRKQQQKRKQTIRKTDREAVPRTVRLSNNNRSPVSTHLAAAGKKPTTKTRAKKKTQLFCIFAEKKTKFQSIFSRSNGRISRRIHHPTEAHGTGNTLWSVSAGTGDNYNSDRPLFSHDFQSNIFAREEISQTLTFAAGVRGAVRAREVARRAGAGRVEGAEMTERDVECDLKWVGD